MKLNAPTKWDKIPQFRANVNLKQGAVHSGIKDTFQDHVGVTQMWEVEIRQKWFLTAYWSLKCFQRSIDEKWHLRLSVIQLERLGWTYQTTPEMCTNFYKVIWTVYTSNDISPSTNFEDKCGLNYQCVIHCLTHLQLIYAYCKKTRCWPALY